MKTYKSLAILLCFAALLLSCNNKKHEPLRIALSSASANYEKWILRTDSTAVTVDFAKMPVDSALNLLASCDGLILTGGEDVMPSYYGKTADSARCNMNPGRDVLEFALIHRAMKLNIPILGICRGQQILNVAMGGTLIIDIPSDHPSAIIHQQADYLKCFHQSALLKSSNLMALCQSETGMVTSNHHQAIEKLAKGFRAVAWSADSIIEAIEYENPSQKPFLQAVQWHPERMAADSPLSAPLIRAFLKSAGENEGKSSGK